MKEAAIGVRVHSGWGVLVAVSDNDGEPAIVERKHITIIDSATRGTKQPYHFVESFAIEDAESHLSACASASQKLARAAIDGILHSLRRRDNKVVGCALLLASGRKLPSLPDILASHALIHTAEGEFFRRLFRDAFDQLHVPVTGFRERELHKDAKELFGNEAAHVVRKISDLRKSIGSPWTIDEKSAALAAWMLLSGNPQ